MHPAKRPPCMRSNILSVSIAGEIVLLLYSSGLFRFETRLPKLHTCVRIRFEFLLGFPGITHKTAIQKLSHDLSLLLDSSKTGL
jgi:hypothetical protein